MKLRCILTAMVWLLFSLPAAGFTQTLSPNLSFEAPSERDDALETTARIGHRLSGEDATFQQPINWMGASVQYAPISQMIVDADFAYSDHDQAYIAQTPIPGQDAAVIVDEERWDTGFNMGYNVLPADVLDGKLALVPRLGLRILWLDNPGFDLTGGGPQVGLTAGYQATDRLTLQGGFAYAHVLFGDADTPSALGEMDGVWSYDVGAEIGFGDRYGLRLSYVGETLTFERAYRVSNGAAFALCVGLL